MLKLALFSALAATASALTISTPASLIECQPVQLSWSDGTAPYYPAVIPAGEASAAALVSFGTQTGTTYTWTVNLAAGTNITLKVTDSTGNTAYTSAMAVQSGTSSACLTESASAGTAASTGSATVAAAAASGSGSATNAASGSSSGSAAASTASAASGASAVKAAGGLAVAAAVAALVF